MTEAAIVHNSAYIFASESWWKPIMGYIVTNCAKFTGLGFTNEEHDCFLGFRKLFTELFDCFVAKKIGVKTSALESAFGSEVSAQNPEAVTIMQMLRDYSDFVFFRQEMVAMSKKIEEATTNRMLEARSQLPQSGELEAAALAELLERGEELLLEAETQRKVTEFAAVLALDPARAPPPQQPRTPRAMAMSPRPTSASAKPRLISPSASGSTVLKAAIATGPGMVVRPVVGKH